MKFDDEISKKKNKKEKEGKKMIGAGKRRKERIVGAKIILSRKNIPSASSPPQI